MIKLLTIPGTDKVRFECDCLNGSFVKRVRECFLYSFGLNSLPSRKIYKKSRIITFKKINKSVLFHITFYLEDGDNKPVEFNGIPISFTRQLNKTYSINELK